MARGGKLAPVAVRAIFRSTEPAPKVAARFKVSANLVYLIRQGKIHKKVTAKLEAPARANGRRGAARADARIDIKVLAHAIVDELMSRFYVRARG